MPKRLALTLVNTLWYSTAILIVLAAVLMEAGREMLPNVNLDDGRMVQLLRERTGADVQITQLRSQWTSLFPEFTASEINIKTPALSLRMEDVHMEFDLVNTLWLKSPVFDRLQIAKAAVHYTQPQTLATDSKPDLSNTWQVLYHLLKKNIRISNVDLTLQQSNKEYTLHLQDFRLEQALFGKKIFLRFLEPDSSRSLNITGHISGSTFAESEGDLYMKMQDWRVHDWLPAANDQQPSALQTLLEQPWQGNGEAWLHWEGKNNANLQAQLQIEDSATPPANIPASASTRLTARWQEGNDTVIDLHSLQLKKSAQESVLPLLQDVRFSLTNSAQWRLQTPSLNLGNITKLGDYLPEGGLKQLLQELHPEGKLRNVDLRWDNNKPLTERMQLRANADNLATGHWHGVPAFTAVNGYLDSGIGYGFIDIDSRNGFSMHYPEIYHDPLAFHQANGRVQWQWLPEQKTVLVGSDYLSLAGEAGDARGNFWLHLPLPGADFHSDMYLAIGLRNSAAKFRELFLPYTLSPNLLAWLKTSIGEATIPAAGFIYRGALSGHEPHSRTIQFFADINNGDLQFDPAWPRITGLNARLLLDDANTSVRAYSGQLLNSSVTGAAVDVRQENPGMSIRVNARANGYTADGLRILRETPLHHVIGNALDNWRMPQGLLSAALQLTIPLSGATVPSQQDVRVSLFDSQLAMDDLRLQFDKVQGDINYDSNTGLDSPAIQAMLFGKPLTLSMNSKKNGNSMTINIDGKGSVKTVDIASWSRLKPLQMLSGNIDFNAGLTVGPLGTNDTSAAIGQLRINSDMTDVSAPLPAPFVTQAGIKKPLALTVDLFRNNRQNYRMDFNGQLSGAISMQQGQFFGGELVLLGESAALPSSRGTMKIRGDIPAGDLQQWLDLISTYNQLPGNDAAADTPLPEFAFSIHDAFWRELSFPQLRLSAEHEDDAWRIYFDSGNARGSAYFHDDKSITDINLSELKLYNQTSAVNDANPDGTTATTTPESTHSSITNGIRFADIPSLKIRIDHLVYNDKDIGNISTTLNSSPDALAFEKLLIHGPGYSVYNQMGTDGAAFIWRQDAPGKFRSEFHGMLHMQGEQPALTHLGVDPFVRGQNIYVAADLGWAGSPDEANMKTLSGQVYTRGEKGKYLQVKPNAAMQALSVIDITNWVRRLRLDFSDLKNDGISFDRYKGRLSFNNGLMEFTEPLKVESPSSTMELSGKAKLNEELLDLQLNATLPVGNNATWMVALAGGLPAAAGIYVVSKLFDDQIKSLTSLTYTITGPMKDPDIRFQRLSKPQKKAEASVQDKKQSGKTDK